MADPVVHVEVIGRDPAALRAFYAQVFGWHTADAPVAAAVSDPDAYGFLDPPEGAAGVAGGIGGGPGFTPHTLFYVGVADVERALARAESSGGVRVLGPAARPDGGVVVGQFRDPEGNLIGVAGPH